MIHLRILNEFLGRPGGAVDHDVRPVVATAAVLDGKESDCQCRPFSEFPEGTPETTHWLSLPPVLTKLVKLLRKAQNCRKLKSAQPLEAKKGWVLYGGTRSGYQGLQGKRRMCHFLDFDRCPHQKFTVDK